jgi:hypothetical protein
VGASGAARQAEREAAPWIEKLARVGYAAKGLVYLLVGGLAAAAALSGGPTADASGALASVADETWGRVLLAIIAVGLLGYVIWRAIGAVRNPENVSTGKRIFFAITGAVHAALAVEAGRLALQGRGGGGGRSGGDGAAHWSAELMAQPFGPWLVGLVGLAIGLYGIQQLVNAWRVDLDDHLDLATMAADARRWTVRMARFGIAARGVVFAIIGGFFLTAALQSDPAEARGVGGVLDMMRGTPWLLGVVALGLVAYGLYNIVRARYRVIRPA